MENLVYCLNATIPIFLTLMLGYFFKRIKVFDEAFVSKLNKFVFKIALPALLFQDISKSDFYSVWDTKMVLFCFTATLICIGISIMLSFLIKKSSIQGEFVQASYRSSAALLGIAIIQNLYGNAGMAPLMIIASVPLYNIMAVVTLSFFSPSMDHDNKLQLKKTLLGIITNPIILGIFAGMIWSLLKRPMPVMIDTTINNIGRLATPLGLMAMGGALSFEKAFSQIKATLSCMFLKLVGYELLFFPIAVLLNFRTDKLVAIIIMLGSATTASCYIMAKNMGHEGDFTSGVIMLTTLASSFTLTFWLFIARSFGFI